MSRDSNIWKKAVVLYELWKLWCRAPDLRLGQLIINTAWMLGPNNKEDVFTEIYFIEDYDLVEDVNHFVDYGYLRNGSYK